MQVVVGRLDFHFRRKYLKGLLSIPCDGRGARRPLGQSFRESVGPAEHPLLASSYPLSQPVVVSSGFGESHCMCQGKHLSDSASSEDLVRISKSIPRRFSARPTYGIFVAKRTALNFPASTIPSHCGVGLMLCSPTRKKHGSRQVRTPTQSNMGEVVGRRTRRLVVCTCPRYRSH